MLEKTRWNSEPSRPTGNDGRDPRLQHGIACHDPAGGGVEARPVERVRHLADQPVHRVARQPGVGVERDDVADAGGHRRRLPAEVQEAGVGRAAQQPVQFVQLAALAFPADPPRLAGVPDPLAVQQQEAVAAGRRTVAPIEPGDAGDRRFQQRRIAVDMLGRGIQPVGEQREMQVALRAGEVVDLQMLDLLLDRRRGGQQRRHRDERAQLRGHAVAQFQGGQQRRAEAARHGAVDQRHRRVDGRDRTQHAEQAQPRRRRARARAGCSSGMARRTAATAAPAPT